MRGRDHLANSCFQGAAARVLGSKERSRVLYTRLAPFYDVIRPRNRVQPIVELLDIKPGQSLLDCGTGPGVYALRLARKDPNIQVCGVDLCSRFVNIAQKRAAKRKLHNVLFAVGDLEALDFDDETFDRLVCVRALSVVHNKRAAVRELARVLKTGGRAVLVEPLKGIFPWKELGYVFWLAGVRAMSVRFPELRGVGRRDYGGEYFTPSSLRQVLTHGCFSDVQIKSNISLLVVVCQKGPNHHSPS